MRFPASFRPPVTQSGGPGRFAFDTATAPPAVPLVSPGLPSGDVGTYTVTGAPTVTSTGGITYRLFSTDGSLTVTPAELTITADNKTKRYGRELQFRGTEFKFKGLVSGDTITSVDLASPGAGRSANVGEGPFRITASGAEGTGLVGAGGVSNYTITYLPGTPDPDPSAPPRHRRGPGQALRQRLRLRRHRVQDPRPRQRRPGGLRPPRERRRPGRSPPLGQPLQHRHQRRGRPGALLRRRAELRHHLRARRDAGAAARDPARSARRRQPARARPPLPDLRRRPQARLDYDYLPNPPDEIEIAGTEAFGTGGGSGGPTLGPTRPGGATLARETAQDTLSFLEALSGRLEPRVSACNPVPPNTDIFLACVRDALTDYASELDSRILDLPPPLRSVSAVIRKSASEIEGVRADAARRIALATSDAEVEAIQREAALRAGAAVQTAVVEIRKAIELIRAEDDPQLASLQSRQGAAITAALQNVEDELSQAVEL